MPCTIWLEPHQCRTVTFTVTEEMLRYYTKSMAFASEPGDFERFIGPNSRDLQKAGFTLTEK